ncbi:MAG: fec operon regulator FecR [candidate division WS6 bacterium OLB20]|uniref:Fec operon regulator FecR n=1 Tax=candidate division WS6 bacterium OLB20 TaxID=1617426 RepID=A0A136LYM1_9BACT|nr:MAG: fec operon regulator FecR [candidate division WS6 bacterium OLB20]
MQTDKRSTTPDAFFSNSRVGSRSVQNEAFKDELREKLAALYVDNISSREHSQSSMSIKKLLMSKPFLGFAAAAVVIVTGAALLFGSTDLSDTIRPDSKLGAELIYSEGTVEYRTDEGWYTADEAVQLAEGSSVRTLGESRSIINLDDGSAIRLDYDTEITISSLDPDDIKVTLAEGSVYTRVAKLDRDFAVVTDDASYLSLGTAYRTTKNDVFEGVRVYESKVQVDKAEGEDVVVEAGKGYNVKAATENKTNAFVDVTIESVKGDKFALWNREKDLEHVEDEKDLGILKDLTAPELQISAPADGQEVTADKVVVTGTTEAGARVFVNGEEISTNNGSFSREVFLNEGENKIKVKSMDAAGNRTEKYVMVFRKAEGSAPKPTTKPAQPSSSLSLSGTVVSDGVKLSWSVSNLDVSGGFKVLKSTSPNPTFPANNLYYIGDGSKRHTTVQVNDGKSYYFRICRYNLNTGGCDVYSNTVQVTAPDNTPVSTVSSISLSSAGGGTVNWSYSGTLQNGFKVLWSKSNSGLVYPPGSGVNAHYTGGTTKTVDAFDGPGTYYIRVCEYLNGTCGTYSNTVSVDL